MGSVFQFRTPAIQSLLTEMFTSRPGLLDELFAKFQPRLWDNIFVTTRRKLSRALSAPLSRSLKLIIMAHYL